VLGRKGCGCEVSPSYCDVIVRRLMNLTGETPVLAGTDQTFEEAAVSRGVVPDQALKPKHVDARAIRHNGPNPCYGPKRKPSGEKT
jgi:hypothetical protein